MSSPSIAPDHDPLLVRLCRRRPGMPLTYGLIAANLAVYALMLAFGAGIGGSDNSVQLAWGANFGPATEDGQWWRLGSAMFVHFGLLHLGMNMWALWDSGRLAERIYGPGRFAALYGTSGLMGNLLSLVAHQGQAISGGASGAIFGVFGALLVYLRREWRRLETAELRWMFLGVAGFTAASIAFGLLMPGIDNAAHLGGLLAGVLLGTALMEPPEGAAPSRKARATGLALLALMVAVLVARIPEPSYRWSDEQRVREEIRDFLGEDARITRRWQAILEEGRQGKLTFDEAAGRIESDVAAGYERSFDDLAELHPDQALPSARTLEELRRYAELRRDASRALAEGLRAQDSEQVRKALEVARRAPQLAKPAPSAPRVPGAKSPPKG